MKENADLTVPGMVLVHGTLAHRIAMALISAIPSRLRSWWRGPVETLSFETGQRVRRTWLRPVEVLLPAELVLRHRLTIPSGARQDLRSAIALFVAHKTPFEPRDLLVHAAKDGGQTTGVHSTYTVHAVPRGLVDGLLKERGVPRQRVRCIGVSGTGVDFAPALSPGLRWRRWSFLLPTAVALISLAAWAAGDLSTKADHLAALEAEVSATLVRVRDAGGALEAQSKAATGIGEVRQLLEASPSAYLTLVAIRELLPGSTEIARIQSGGGETRLSIRTPDALDVVRALNSGAVADWSASIEGPITSDGGSGREVATILLRGAT